MRKPVVRQANPINITLIDHVVLRVADLQCAIEFYRDVLGCKVERHKEHLGLVQLRAGASLVDLIDIHGELGRKGGKLADNSSANMDHFCLQISPWNGDTIRQHLQDNNVVVGEIAQRYGARGEGPSLYIKDPDGNTVELKGV